MILMFTLAEAETKLADLLDLAEAGEEVVIERPGKSPIYLSQSNPRRRKSCPRPTVTPGIGFSSPKHCSTAALW